MEAGDAGRGLAADQISILLDGELRMLPKARGKSRQSKRSEIYREKKCRAGLFYTLIDCGLFLIGSTLRSVLAPKTAENERPAREIRTNNPVVAAITLLGYYYCNGDE